MKLYSIGEVSRILGVKPYVIRYWESEVPLLSPRKGMYGRREYSARDIQLLLKFKVLLYEKKYTVEGARRRIWEDANSPHPDLLARFAQIRGDLLDILLKISKWKGDA